MHRPDIARCRSAQTGTASTAAKPLDRDHPDAVKHAASRASHAPQPIDAAALFRKLDERGSRRPAAWASRCRREQMP